MKQERTTTPDRWTPIIKRTIADRAEGRINNKQYATTIRAIWMLRNLRQKYGL